MLEAYFLNNVVYYRVCISEIRGKQLGSVSPICSQIYLGIYFVLAIGRNRELLLGRSMELSDARGNWILK